MVSAWSLHPLYGLRMELNCSVRSMVSAWSLHPLCGLSCGMDRWSLHSLYGRNMELPVSGLWSQHGVYIRSMVSAWSLHPLYGFSMELASVLWSQHGTYIHSVVSASSIQCLLYGLSMEHTVSAYTDLGQWKHTHPTTVQHNRSALSLACWVLLLLKVGSECIKFTLLTSLWHRNHTSRCHCYVLCCC